MPKLYPIQNSFAAGEISPFMYGRNDTEAYKSGAKTARNMRSDPRGPLVSRAGMQHIGRVTGSDAKLLGFVATDDTSFLIFITSSNIVFYDLSNLTVEHSSILSPYAEPQLVGIKRAVSPTSNDIYLLHPEVQPQKLSYSSGVWSVAAVTFTGKPSNWTGTNWPSCGTFTEGRLWLGGAPDKPSEFWASKSNSYEDFTTGATAEFAFNRDIAYPGKILWMQGIKDLVIGTTTPEFVCTSNNGVMWNEDIQISRQSTYGSKSVDSLQIGDQVMYVSPDGKKLRSIQYDWSQNSWVSQDITFISNHITESGIRDVAWAQNPNNLLLAPLENGGFVTLTYDRSNRVYGWNSQNTDGLVKDAASVEYQGNSYLFVATVRDAGNIDIELMLDESKQMDSWIEQDFGLPVTTVTGLLHLEGKEVQILGDGAVYPNKVVSFGEVTIDYPAQVICVGLKFVPKLETLPLAQQYSMGNSRTHVKRRIRVNADMLDSYLPLINGRRPPERNPSTPMGYPESAISGLVDAGDLGYDNEATIVIEQDLPLPITILSLYADTSSDSL